MPMPESARWFLEAQIERLKRLPRKRRIVFPEGEDTRVQSAAQRLVREGLIDPVLIGANLKVEDVRAIDPEKCSDQGKYAAILLERRKSKGITEIEANNLARVPLYFASLMVAAGHADGAVGGAVNTTAETVRAAITCVGPASGIDTISGIFFMCVQDSRFGARGVLAFADCALVADPTAVQVAQIAMVSASSFTAIVGAEPKIALLSFSTKGSAKHPYAQKMTEALRILKERAPDLKADGELQADAALVGDVAAHKAPGSMVAGNANVLVFPDLGSANISYKLVERLGNAVAIGPFLQGLAKPVNDLSRGCSAEDIYFAAIVTALQSSDS